LWLDIAMDDIAAMDVLNDEDELEDPSGNEVFVK
jgi:hypothetical protein